MWQCGIKVAKYKVNLLLLDAYYSSLSERVTAGCDWHPQYINTVLYFCLMAAAVTS